MADVTAIASALTGLKTAGDIAKSFLDLKDVAKIQGKTIELQSVILAAQSAGDNAVDSAAMTADLCCLRSLSISSGNGDGAETRILSPFSVRSPPAARTDSMRAWTLIYLCPMHHLRPYPPCEKVTPSQPLSAVGFSVFENVTSLSL